MKKLFLLILILSFPSILSSQENTKFYGYIQPAFWHYQSDTDFGTNKKYNTGGISQANFLVSTEFKNDLSVLVNFELINNFSSDKGWGSLNLQEAYLKYAPNENINLKFGQIIPAFNNLFENYYKTSELPYLLRPKLYEISLGNLVDIFDFLPQKALLQASGTTEINSGLFLDYSASINHAINKFYSSPDNDMLPYYVAYGQSSQTYLGYGGRAGIRTGGLKLGVSAYSEVANYRKFKWTEDGHTVDLGDMGRIKAGADISFKFADFTLSAEYMMNKVDISDRRVDVRNIYEENRDTTFASVENFLAFAHSKNKVFIGDGFDRSFYYVSLMYNPSEETFVYVMYDCLQDKIDPYFFGPEGYKGVSLGCGWNVNNNVVLKAQGVYNFMKYENLNDDNNYIITDFSEIFIAVGASISL